MEGDDDKPDEPHVISPPTTTTTTTTASGAQSCIKDTSVNPNAVTTLSPPPGRDLDTYVVQFPRDQIYRVPPPENAKIVQLYQKPVKRERSVCCKRLFWCFLILIILGVVGGAIAISFNLVFSPTAPTFSVQNLDVNSAKSGKSTVKTFEIGVKANNPNAKMGIKYKESSVNAVSISFKNKNIGEGTFPELSQDAKGSDKVDLKLQASKNAALPNAKSPAAFTLEFDVYTEFNVGAVTVKKKRVVVSCDIKAKGFETEKVKILSENCESKFKN